MLAKGSWPADSLQGFPSDTLKLFGTIDKGVPFNCAAGRFEEALKLFENPMGTIPISRPMLPNARSPLSTKAGPSDPTLEDLISSFRNLD